MIDRFFQILRNLGPLVVVVPFLMIGLIYALLLAIFGA